MRNLKFLTLAALSLVSVPVFATDFFETEGNDSKAAANWFTGVVAGDRIIGNSVSSTTTGIDTFKLTMATSTMGIYQHRLVITSNTAGHTGSIRGWNVTGGVAGGATGTVGTTDTAIQTSSTTTTPSRFNQWYGFGKGESLYYRVTGSASTTADYTATVQTTQITPVNLGVYQPGAIDFTTYDLAKSPNGTTFSYTDTEMTLFDANFNTISAWNNDDWFPASSTHAFHSELHLNLNPGVYYFAVSQFNLATNLVADPTHEAGPNDSVLDFSNMLVESSSTSTHGSPAVPVSLDFSITNNGNTTVFDAAKPGAYGVYWGRMEVVPEPATMAVLGLGLIPFLRRRKK